MLTTVTSWKTTSLGIMSIVGAVIGIVFAVINKTITPEIITGSVAAILAGIGLIFAKDGDVTGGSKTLGTPLK